MPGSGDQGTPRVAIVGAGPAGIYAAEALTRQDGLRVQVDVLDRLPTPYGLVRYGVAPDHPTIKSVVSTMAAILRHPGVRFLGNVEVGRDLDRRDLAASYEAVIYATGAPSDRRLGIPGEDLPGSISATEFVAWYNGHPDATDQRLDATDVVVVGAGNVALDIARVLARPYADLARTDIPSAVLDRLRTNAARHVHLLARRGPADARFSTKELRELGAVPQVAVTVDRTHHEPVSVGEADRRVSANLRLFAEWASRPAPAESTRSVTLRFHAIPVEIIGRDRVESVRIERTAVDADGRMYGTGEFTTIPAGLVVRSIGYRGVGVAGLPFDETRCVVPNTAGRVSDQDCSGTREYVAGWLKRGPTGVIGTNKVDAKETVRSLLDDLATGRRHRPDPDRTTVDELLRRRGVRVVAFSGWEAIERAELELGASEGRTRSKITEWHRLRALGSGTCHARNTEESERT
ncbi:MAG TPA: FAD-dependent oxidoreductase [Pseudonocardiaceae bacterium]|jgi:ferredoxin--NADP+ reductase|nr:FAD-dependent oxidoreductase [Pseudonocardiaceae bacterium]